MSPSWTAAYIPNGSVKIAPPVWPAASDAITSSYAARGAIATRCTLLIATSVGAPSSGNTNRLGAGSGGSIERTGSHEIPGTVISRRLRLGTSSVSPRVRSTWRASVVATATPNRSALVDTSSSRHASRSPRVAKSVSAAPRAWSNAAGSSGNIWAPVASPAGVGNANAKPSRGFAGSGHRTCADTVPTVENRPSRWIGRLDAYGSGSVGMMSWSWNSRFTAPRFTESPASSPNSENNRICDASRNAFSSAIATHGAGFGGGATATIPISCPAGSDAIPSSAAVAWNGSRPPSARSGRSRCATALPVASKTSTPGAAKNVSRNALR